MGVDALKVYEYRETDFHIDDSDQPEEIWLWWGRLKRRVRFRAEYVTVKWSRMDGEAWTLAWVTVSGSRIHTQTESTIGETYVDCGVVKRSMPDWLAALVDLSKPSMLTKGGYLMYDHETDEWRRGVRAMSETDRAAACGHSARSRDGVCYDCGEEGDRG